MTLITPLPRRSGYNATTKTAQGFNGDATARSVLESLGNIRTTVPTELATATFKTLAGLGITIQQSGALSLDSAQLKTAISTSSTEVIKTLRAYGKAFGGAVNAMQSGSGSVAVRVEGLKNAVKSFQSNQTTLEYRISLIETRYRSQFSALDTLISKMNALSSRLSQTLSTSTQSS